MSQQLEGSKTLASRIYGERDCNDKAKIDEHTDNSIDAQATNILCGLNVDTKRLVIADDGTGMKNAFDIIGINAPKSM